MVDLLHCPFCGSGQLYETRRNGYCDETPTMFCNSCKAVVTWEQVEEEGVSEETKTFVREHWNKRAAMEFDNWFYLPKPKEQVVEATETTHAWDGMKVKTDVFYQVREQAVANWAKELDKHIIKRICEVWNPRTDDYKQAAEYWQRMYERAFVERTCRNISGVPLKFRCSECGDVLGKPSIDEFRYCPSCGCKVVEE